MIQITRSIAIDEKEIKLEFIRSSGPGGQHVNKVSTAVLLRFDITNSPSLSDFVKTRLIRIAGNRVSSDGILNIKAQSGRTQEQNRREAVKRLTRLVERAAEKPKPRLKTRPSLAKKQQRLEKKQHRSKIKHMRRRIGKSPPDYD
ncbi:MAG: alternative ribosome rescue aminoacyl-tRNA hydrolase ArfB [Desulfobacterales bacterium]